MIKKKSAARKGSAGRRKSVSKKKRPVARPTKKKRAVKAVRKRKKVAARKPAAKRSAVRGARKRGAARKVRGKAIGPGRRVRDLDLDTLEPLQERGLGLEAGGQSGDTEGLSRAELAASESVEELLEEGQAFEAGIVDGVESAPDADRGPIRTREVPEDDVPEEYIDQDRERS
jgi:hypothetical protein